MEVNFFLSFASQSVTITLAFIWKNHSPNRFSDFYSKGLPFTGACKLKEFNWATLFFWC